MSHVDDWSEESDLCKKCGSCIALDAGCDPSDYCHMCCQDLVAKLTDTTPITEDWAAKVRSELVSLELNKAKEWWIIAGDIEGFVKTRGQVHCLLLAAGIECES